MKKNFILLFFTGLLISACAPNVRQPAAIDSTELVAQSTPTSEDVALPAEVEAPIIDAPEILNIEMKDETNGWALTEKNVVRTNDGGVTWYDVTPAGLSDVGYFIYTDFFDAAHAWLLLPDMNNQPNGGKLYRTADGGLTWQSFVTPFSDGSLYFVDQQNGWVMANLGAGAGSNAVSIFKTRDGGETWARAYTNDPNLEGAADTLPLGGLKNFILPLNVNTAWVGGVIYAPGQIYLFRTDDAGATWSNVELALPENSGNSELSAQGILFTSAREGLLALRITAENPETIIYRTQDGGDTWAQLPVTFEGYGSLSTPSASEMIFYADDQFYVTKDAGATIQQVTPDVLFGYSIIDMSFVNSQTGWVVTEEDDNRSLYRTSDGGATWIVQIP